ncbi:MAG: glycosyltransferase [Candidatus Levybacteria bacterium]|nr:glycosyltransferase [Candidatus Levybacteria bacterium]
MKLSFICTVFNEEKTIKPFLNSLFNQSRMPDEIVIVDGGSSDLTIANIKYQILNIKYRKILGKINFKILVKKGNRSVGRNEAIKNASGNIILCSDAGCILDKNWVENIIEPFKDSKVDVVAGFYKGFCKTIFEKCLIPYVLVMPDKADPKNFLPASRTMAFTKDIWEKIGGFDESLSHNEDYVFAKNLEKNNAKIVFRRDAVVSLIPRKNLREAFHMFYRFAKGDSEAKILRPKVALLFLRYLAGFSLITFFLTSKSNLMLSGLLFLFFAYLVWAVLKNYRYVKHRKAFYILPVLQITSDAAVILGTLAGILKIVGLIIIKNKRLTVVIGIYSLVMLSVIRWGIPNSSHPYTYFMDEWHQVQAVKSILLIGTPNVEGAAHGSMFQFLLSGIYLVPFVFLGLKPYLFQILRINTLIFGILSIVILAKIAKDYFRISPLTAVLMFTVTPIWLSLSNYFKYDIALMFWILTSFMFVLRYSANPTLANFIFAGIFSAVALATKLSAIPLLLIYIFSFFLFSKKIKYIRLFYGIVFFIITFVLLGVPDILFGRGDYYEFFYSNLISGPRETYNLLLGMNFWEYLAVKQFPLIFGHVSFFLFAFSFLYLLFELLTSFFKRKVIDKNKFLLFFSMTAFSLSLIPLKLGATGNRALVLLPFLVLIAGVFFDRILKLIPNKYYGVGLMVFSMIFFVQVIESFSWIYIKLSMDPRQSSSNWIANNIQKKNLIGIENIPIYQMLPDLLLKEYYANSLYYKLNYSYEVVNDKTIKLPDIIIITNREIDAEHVMSSPKKTLLDRLRKENYKQVSEFYPDWSLYKIFGNQLDFSLSGLVPSPTVTVFIKRTI